MSRPARLILSLLVLLLAHPVIGQEKGIAQALYENALQLLRTGKTEEALKRFEEIYSNYGASERAPDALFQAATYYYPYTELEDLGQAPRDAIQKTIPLLQKIRSGYGSSSRAPEAIYLLGLLALEPDNPAGNPNEAYAAFTSVADVYPESPRVGHALYGAAVSQMRAEAYESALEDFSRLLEQVPDFPGAPEARLAFADCLFRAGDFQRSMEELQEVRALYPSKPEAREAVERLTLMHRLRLEPLAGRNVVYAVDPEFNGKMQVLGVKSLVSMASDPEGELLIGDGRGGSIVKVDASGRTIARIVLENVSAVAMDRGGTPVAAGGGVLVYGKQQRLLNRPEASSTRPIKDVVSLAADRGGRTLAADGKSGEVLLFGRGGEFKTALHKTTSGKLAEVRVGLDDQVYVLDSKDKTISLYSEGKVVSRLRLDEPPASIAAPLDFAVDDLGDLYVVDGAAARIVVLDPTGKRILSTILAEKGKGVLTEPQRVEVDRQGRVYVYDRRSDAIVRFR
jgi:TolA-binding protein